MKKTMIRVIGAKNKFVVKMNPRSKAYRKELLRKIHDWLDVGPCKRCGHPIVTMYLCDVCRKDY